MNDSKNLRNFKDSTGRRQFLEQALKIRLDNISRFSFSEDQVLDKNIENLIGATQIPLGVTGPISIQNSKFKIQNFFVPLATTEGALIASVSRGCKAILESGGVHVEYHNVGVTRAPVFKTSGIKKNVEVKKWIGENYEQIKRLCESTSSHLKLLKYIDR